MKFLLTIGSAAMSSRTSRPAASSFAAMISGMTQMPAPPSAPRTSACELTL